MTRKTGQGGVGGMSSPEWKKANPERYEKAKKKQAAFLRKHNSDKNHQRNAGKMSRYWENKGVLILNKKYTKVYPAFRICDRICFDGKKLIFCEIKKKGQKLRPLQKEFKELCDKIGINYEIIYV